MIQAAVLVISSPLLRFFPVRIILADPGGTFRKNLASWIYVARKEEKG